MVLLLQLPSVQPANAKKSQFILFVNAILLARIASCEKFTSWPHFDPPINRHRFVECLLLHQSVEKFERGHTFRNLFSYALAKTSRIAQSELFHDISISKLDQKAGGDTMIFQILTLSIWLSSAMIRLRSTTSPIL
jgi:hypothetical protein